MSGPIAGNMNLIKKPLKRSRLDLWFLLHWPLTRKQLIKAINQLISEQGTLDPTKSSWKLKTWTLTSALLTFDPEVMI